ncbi:MAG: dihydrodipicolinate synthase family protein [Chloroflexota bacterium]
MAKKFDLANDRSSLHGIVPPILTPMNQDETVDAASMKKLVDFMIVNGVHGLWVMGTTGEFASFDERERGIAVEAAVEANNGRVPVVANVGDCSTRLAIRHAKVAKAAGVDALAATPPYYFANAQDELLAHFREIRAQVDLPLLLYNIPQTVKVKTAVGTALTLGEEGTIIGLKDSQNDLDWFRQVTVGAKARGIDLRCFLGTRYLIDAGQVIGGHGSIPSLANVAPGACVAVYEAARRGDWAEAARHQEHLMAMERITQVPQGGCFNAQIMGAMKTILMQNGIIATNVLGSPLRTLTAAEAEKLAKVAAELELGKGS